jgi:hypothetical protein
MNTKEQSLWKQLQDQELVSGNQPATNDTPATPWYLRAMLGFMGWIGAILIIGVLYLGLHDALDSNPGRFIIGGIMGAIAIQLYRGREDKDLRMQFALALGICAQVLTIWAIADTFSGQPVTTALLVMAMQLLPWVITNNSTVRFGTAIMATTAFLFILYHFGWSSLIPALLIAGACTLWSTELSLIRYRHHLIPAAWAITLLGLIMLSKNDFSRWLSAFPGESSGTHPLLLALQGALSLVAVITTTGYLLKEQDMNPSGVRGLLSGALLLLLCLIIPGIGFSLLLVLLGFGRGNYLLIGLSLAALLFHLSKYYYLLEISLLNKSLLLAGSGILLLLSREVILRSRSKKKEET